MLDDTAALVTGASGGIGRRIAAEFAARGAEVTLAARSEGTHGTADAVDAPEGTLPVETDVTDEAAVEVAVEATAEDSADSTPS